MASDGGESVTPNERIESQDIEDELKESYLTYAMSVIVSRALPDARDGLKPSQRRILISMNDLHLGPKAKHRKCAKIVGECMGNYHPHGNDAIYGTLVRMAQDFNTRYLLIDGHGNFGSIDGDPPAAMRYTEARMAAATGDLLQDLDMETVDMTRSFDDQLDEPTVLPSRFPNLVCNGSTGIAVGMATSMPPHNVREVCGALEALIENPDITIDGLMEHIQGPDFPTGGLICGRQGIYNAYRSGRGLLNVRSKYHIEEHKKRKSIIFTEIPYQESKVNIIEGISNAVKEDKITGISDVRDESDKKIRLVVELKLDADEDVVVNQLFKFTQLETTFSIINIALVKGRPETLTLKEILNEYKKHRMEIIRRRTRFQLRKAEERAHLVEGLLKALDHIDRIIALIRGSATVDEARGHLMTEFAFSEVQAQEILNMRLQRLTGLERKKLEEELGELRAKIEEYRGILRSERLVLDLILKDLKEIKELYGDDRRTQIIDESRDVSVEDLITEEEVVVTVSREGYVKRTALSTYRSQGRGGRGITGSTAKEGDYIKDLFVASTHDYILFLTNRGRLYWLKVYDIPDMGRTTRGRALANLVQLDPGESVHHQLCVREFDEKRCIILATRQGTVKKTNLSAFSKPKKVGIIAISLNESDSLIGAAIVSEGDEVILGTKHGTAIRFPEKDARAMGRTAAGVGGISLREGDEVVDMVIVDPKVEGLTLLTVCENGHGKRTPVGEYRLQRRNGSGTINIKATERNGFVVGMKAVTDEHDLVLMTQVGLIMRMAVSDLRAIGRATQGVRLINLKEGDKLISIERVVKETGEEGVERVSPPPEASEPPPAEGFQEEGSLPEEETEAGGEPSDGGGSGGGDPASEPNSEEGAGDGNLGDDHLGDGGGGKPDPGEGA
jgi:DNA gyrase subunit A